MAGTGSGSQEVSAMKYAGMPFGMWVLFAGSFQKQLTAVLAMVLIIWIPSANRN